MARHLHRRVSLLLFVCATVLYLLTMQRAIYGDGIFFEPKLREADLTYPHILYLPLVWTIWSGLSSLIPIDAETGLKVVSAMAGGAGVALTYLIAARAMRSFLRALTAALMLMAFWGYWFHSTATELHTVHATCALVLLLGLLHTIETRDRITQPTMWLLFLGTILTPASHTSGIAMGLPILYVVWRAGAARGQVLAAVGAGLVLFPICYFWVVHGSDEIAAYTKNHLSVWATLTSPAELWHRTVTASRELLMFTLPASTLILAGLRVLFRTAPTHAWLCLLWVIAWPLAVLPVEDFAYGSYHTPTFAVQSILAVVACHALAQSLVRTVLVILLAALPVLPVLSWGAELCQQTFGIPGMQIGLLLWCINSILLCALAGKPPGTVRWLLALPLSTLVVAAILLPPLLRDDPIRDRIRTVAQHVGSRDLVFFMARDTVTHHHWERFFPGASRLQGLDRRAFNLRELDFISADALPAVSKDLQDRVQQAIDRNESIWTVGNIQDLEGEPAFNQIIGMLRRNFELRHPEEAPQGLFRLTPKKRQR